MSITPIFADEFKETEQALHFVDQVHRNQCSTIIVIHTIPVSVCIVFQPRLQSKLEHSSKYLGHEMYPVPSNLAERLYREAQHAVDL